MARATKEEAQKTKQRILDTAIALFDSQGVSATTLEHIAEAASLTRGAIYWHFKNKGDVVAAIHDQVHLSIMATMHHDLTDRSRPPMLRLKAAAQHFLTSLRDDPLRAVVIRIFMSKCDYSGDMSVFLEQQNENRQTGLKMFAACFDEALQAGDIACPNADAAFLALALRCYITGIVTEYAKNPRMFASDNDIERLVDFYFRKIECGKAA